MALTLESFWRYASSTCQRTSSDREPTLRSSKFWGGRLLASRLCKASYKFVCCGLLRAWCSRGRPMVVSRAARLLLVLHRGVEGSVVAFQGERWRLPCNQWPPLPGLGSPAGCALRAVISAGCWRRLHAQTAPRTSIGAIRTPPWGDCHCGFGFGFASNSHRSKAGARATDASGAAQLRTHAAVVPQRQHLPHSKCTRIG